MKANKGISTLAVDSATSNWKNVRVQVGSMPRLKPSSKILVINDRLKLRTMTPTEVLMAKGFPCQSVHVELCTPTARGQAISDVMPLPFAMVLLMTCAVALQ